MHLNEQAMRGKCKEKLRTAEFGNGKEREQGRGVREGLLGREHRRDRWMDCFRTERSS